MKTQDGPTPLDVPTPVPPTFHVCSLKDYGVAPARGARRAQCFVCDSPIAAGSFRFQYRHLVGFAMRGLRYLHSDCISGIPIATRDLDCNILRRWIYEDGGVEPRLAAALAALRL